MTKRQRADYRIFLHGQEVPRTPLYEDKAATDHPPDDLPSVADLRTIRRHPKFCSQCRYWDSQTEKFHRWIERGGKDKCPMPICTRLPGRPERPGLVLAQNCGCEKEGP